MKKLFSLTIVALTILLQMVFGQKSVPHLEKVGDKYQLMVQGEPFLMLAGELGNSTASTIESMEPVWQRMNDLNINTILIPVYWELLEPKEGKFDFAPPVKDDMKILLLIDKAHGSEFELTKEDFQESQ